MHPGMTEKAVQSLISDWLSLNHIVHWRQNSGAFSRALPVPSSSTLTFSKSHSSFIRFSFFLFPGDDNLAFLDLAGIYQGFFFAIECKRPGAKPTVNQVNTINLINSQGGLALWADALETVIKEFQVFFKQSFTY